MYIAPGNDLQGAMAQYAAKSNQEHRGKPFLFLISALGSFLCITQYTGPTALRPIRETKHHGEVSCLMTQVSLLGLNM